MSLTAAEREAVIQVDDSRGDVQLYSAQRPVIRRVLDDDRWTVIEHGEFRRLGVHQGYVRVQGLVSHQRHEAQVPPDD